LIDSIYDLNGRSVPFILSYDGMTGNVIHGEPLPDCLNMQRLFIEAGRSSQATLNGINALTVESIYLSKDLGGSIQKNWPRHTEKMKDLFAAA
jgi:DNA adenine methylase